MAPLKNAGQNKNLISNFFKPFITQRPQESSREVGDEIVVASRKPQAPETAAAPASQTKTTPTKRGPGRPRKHPASSSSQSSQSDATKSPRPRGRPRKYPPTSSSPSQSSQDGVKKSPRPRGRPRKTESQQQRDDQLGSGSASPPKCQQFTTNPVTGEADVTPAKDSPFRPAGANQSPRRVMTAVAALSPSPPRATADMSAPPPKPPTFGTPAGSAPNASFSSISTLTSVPKSSQASGAPVSSSTSSRRVVSDGLQGVTGSDSESEDLEDPQILFARKRRKLSHDEGVKVLASAPKPQPAKKSTRLSDQQKTRDFFKAFPRSPAKPAPKFSLASLVAEHEKEQISEATIASLESAVEESKKQAEREQAVQDAGLDQEAVLDAAASDSEGRERLLMALARTEALHDKNHYHFFLDSEPLHAKSEFPVDALPDEPWSRIYRNEVSRQQACISGFAAELAERYPLPMSITSWMACQLQYEQSEELCEAYIEILRASGHHEQSISDTWGSLNSVYKTRSLFENNWKERVKIALPAGLAYIIRLVSFRAPAIDSIVSEAPPHSTCAAFVDLALMNVDELVTDDINLSLSIADCIEHMLDVLSEDSYVKLIPLAVDTLFSPSDLPEIARCRAIAALPARTPPAHKLRRRLALEYFKTSDKKDNTPPDWPKSIVRTLKTNPNFHVTESTDYSLLIALTTVLDIAADAGWTDYSLFAPSEPTGPWGQRPPPTEAEKLHNKQIDAISDTLMTMVSRIRDAGTSHLRRTEAKTTIELVIARLQFGVRTRERPTKGVFDGAFGGGMLRQARIGARNFGKKPDKKGTTVRFAVAERGAEADDEGGSGGEKSAVGGARRDGSEHLPMGVGKG